MYTMVLMTALSTAPDAAEFNGFFRRLFSLGGGSCTGSGYGSCDGGGSRLRAYTSCCGGTGRGYGSCSGTRLSAGCSGSTSLSCVGSSFSYSCSGGMVLDPGYAVPAPAVSYFSGPSYYVPAEGVGCTGGLPTYPTMPSPGLGQPFAPPVPAIPPADVADSPSGRGTSFAVGGRATVVVRVPADATLFAEGRRLTLAGTERTFTTPPLPAGDWGYTFRAEYARDGETVSRTKRVGVRAGDSLLVDFGDGTAAARSTRLESKPAVSSVGAVPTVVPPPGVGGPEPARLTIKLPPGATLAVDGKTLRQGGLFRTPPLQPGKQYTYQMAVTTTRDGRPERQTLDVPVKAGELVSLDFASLPK
jgi:uncharacterized protein (TIGR03000 family)